MRNDEDWIDSLIRQGWDVSETGCWIYRGAKDKDGYGIVSGRKKCKKAHRVAFERWLGFIPPGHLVRHRCDNPPCVRPTHLISGTHRDNRRDMLERGRDNVAFGNRKSQTKIFDEELSVIRQIYDEGFLTQQMIADIYGVALSSINRVIKKSRSADKKIERVVDEE